MKSSRVVEKWRSTGANSSTKYPEQEKMYIAKIEMNHREVGGIVGVRWKCWANGDAVLIHLLAHLDRWVGR
jgi:hypothetical protein